MIRKNIPISNMVLNYLWQDEEVVRLVFSGTYDSSSDTQSPKTHRSEGHYHCDCYPETEIDKSLVSVVSPIKPEFSNTHITTWHQKIGMVSVPLDELSQGVQLLLFF